MYSNLIPTHTAPNSFMGKIENWIELSQYYNKIWSYGNGAAIQLKRIYTPMEHELMKESDLDPLDPLFHIHTYQRIIEIQLFLTCIKNLWTYAYQIKQSELFTELVETINFINSNKKWFNNINKHRNNFEHPFGKSQLNSKGIKKENRVVDLLFHPKERGRFFVKGNESQEIFIEDIRGKIPEFLIGLDEKITEDLKNTANKFD